MQEPTTSSQAKQVVVIAGPAGSGKNSLIEGLLKRCTTCSRLITATTREARPGEQDGVDYYFFSDDRFEEESRNGNILEHRDVPTLKTHYGIYKPDLEARLARGDSVFAHVDIVGATLLRETYNAVTFFIMPTSIEELEKRIRLRNPGMSENELRARMDIARHEIAEHAPHFDYRVINADGKLDEAVVYIASILAREGVAGF